MTSTPSPTLVCLNGDLTETLALLRREDYSRIIAADGAVNSLLGSGWTPDIVTGDFDSATAVSLGQAKRAGAQIIPAPTQDATDFEKAITLLEDDPAVREVHLAGHLGSRLDHMLGTLSSAMRYTKRFRFTLLDPVGTGWLQRSDAPRVIRDEVGKRCSVIGLSAARVRLEGFRWDLADAVIGGESPQSVSNEIAEPVATVTVISGVVLVYLHRRAKGE